MKFKFIMGLILITTLCYCQEMGTYQSDSIYKLNHVKARIWYSGSNKKKYVTTYYDIEGRLIILQNEPMISGEQITTYYSYNSDGLLIGEVDTIRNGKPVIDQAQVQLLEKAGLGSLLAPADSNKPAIEISRYRIDYFNNSVIKTTQYKPDGTLDIIDNFKNDGQTCMREWYRNNELYEISTTEYLKNNLKQKFYGWEKMSDGIKMEWNYHYAYIFKNGQIQQHTWFDGNNKKETIKYTYDRNGLLIRYEGDSYTQEYFEYEFYK